MRSSCGAASDGFDSSCRTPSTLYAACRLNVVEPRWSPAQVQNKGGGHGEIGFHLAKNLADKDLTVTIVQDSAAKKEALPFSKYGELPSSVNVEWVDTSDASAVEAACGDKATHVFDNNSKKPGDAAPIISAAKKSDAFYSFVSSSVEIKILRRVRAEASRRPPRHRRAACSMAWRCRFLTARPSQDGRVIAKK